MIGAGGAVTSADGEPLPSCPHPSSPQQVTLPSVSTAQAKARPAVIFEAVPGDGSVTGDGGACTTPVAPPLPSWPWLSSPQQVTAPPVSTAQENA